MLHLDKRFKTVSNCHDEAIFLIPDGQEAEAVDFAERCFAWTPSWLEGCVLKGEVGYGPRYGDC
jgi:hypothetical protein